MKYSHYGLVFVIFFCSQINAGDIRYLKNNPDKEHRAEFCKKVLGFDCTKAETSTEIVLDQVYQQPIIIDQPLKPLDPLPESVITYMSTPQKFKDLITIIAKTYGFEPVFHNVSEITTQKPIIINTKQHQFIEVLEYLEEVTGTEMTVWPRGGGSTIMISESVK